MDSTTATAGVFMLLPQAPIVLVYLVGIIMALMNARHYRRPSMLALSGFVGLLVGAVVHASGILMSLPYYRGSLSIQELATRLATLNILSTVLVLTGTVLILLAIFAGREKKQL